MAIAIKVADDNRFNDWADFGSADPAMETPTITGLSSLSSLMARFDEPTPAAAGSGLGTYANPSSIDMAVYRQTLATNAPPSNYWGQPQPVAAPPAYAAQDEGINMSGLRSLHSPSAQQPAAYDPRTPRTPGNGLS